MDAKYYSGLRLVDATRIAITNHDTSQASISVNGRPLGYQDVALGPLQITATDVKTRDPADNQYYAVLNTNSDIVVQEDPNAVAKVKPGQLMVAGANLNKQQSPAPFAYIDTAGKLNSANLWHSLFVANIMGYVDVDKPATYAHGLVPAGSATHGGLFLRQDGQWGQPSVHTGSVSENLLSLQDTPTDYTGHVDKYLRVSYAEGGSVVFDAIDTSKVPESTNLYYTDTRVDTRMTTKLNDRSFATIQLSGTLTANDVITDSDATLKTDIATIPPTACLDTIDQLCPKQYRFTNSPNTRYGLIAQDVEQVLPTIVHRTDKGTLALSYTELIPFLIGSVRELTARIKSLETATQPISSAPPPSPPPPPPPPPPPNEPFQVSQCRASIFHEQRRL